MLHPGEICTRKAALYQFVLPLSITRRIGNPRFQYSGLSRNLDPQQLKFEEKKTFGGKHRDETSSRERLYDRHSSQNARSSILNKGSKILTRGTTNSCRVPQTAYLLNAALSKSRVQQVFNLDFEDLLHSVD
jgi:hypothetical protein